MNHAHEIVAIALTILASLCLVGILLVLGGHPRIGGRLLSAGAAAVLAVASPMASPALVASYLFLLTAGMCLTTADDQRPA